MNKENKLVFFCKKKVSPLKIKCNKRITRGWIRFIILYKIIYLEKKNIVVKVINTNKKNT